MADMVAKTIGWSAGNPFQFEVGIANLSYGILGVLCWKLKDNFWITTIIGISTFYLGAAYIHIVNIIQVGNMAPGNAGFALYNDIALPIVLIILLMLYKYTSKSMEINKS
jgi:hypothetical protein